MTWPLWRQTGQGEPLAMDLDTARWFGYARPYDIRELIQRYAEELGEVFRTVRKTSGPSGGRPSTTYYLTEEQVLFLAAKSETPMAIKILKAMIHIFMLARRGELPAQRPMEAEELRPLIADEVKKALALQRPASRPHGAPRAPEVSLATLEEQILGCLQAHPAGLIPDVAARFLGQPVPLVRSVLCQLELQGRVGLYPGTGKTPLYLHPAHVPAPPPPPAPQTPADRLADHIRAGELNDAFTLRDVYIRQWTDLDRDGALVAINELVDRGCLQPEHQKPSAGGGRPTILYYVNAPALGKPAPGRAPRPIHRPTIIRGRVYHRPPPARDVRAEILALLGQEPYRVGLQRESITKLIHRRPTAVLKELRALVADGTLHTRQEGLPIIYFIPVSAADTAETNAKPTTH